MKREPGCYPETGEEALQKLGARRRSSVRDVVRDLKAFQVCDLCLSILYRNTRLCPVCGGYRFDPDPERLLFIAAVSGSRDIGYTEPFIPRMRPAARSRKS
jgi:RNA polymerase subunit RPABC4/transcription elongation factor Spt4